ncbi:MAG: SHOCT domain-containing protein [Oscillospiraceae bacterium]|nr:SHOCT domain-containing protein [Oscillospiraceae bacterium]
MQEKPLVAGVFKKLNAFSIIFISLGVINLLLTTSNDRAVSSTCNTLALFSAVMAFFFYYIFSKNEIVVTNKRVYGKVAFGKRIDLPLDKISSISVCAFNGIGVATASGTIKFLFCQNRDVVFNAISSLLIERQEQNTKANTQNSSPTQSNADELKKFKELFDSGIITQEEFDAKKKQLLGL